MASKMLLKNDTVGDPQTCVHAFATAFPPLPQHRRFSSDTSYPVQSGAMCLKASDIGKTGLNNLNTQLGLAAEHRAGVETLGW
jgi:hypothetical protein